MSEDAGVQRATGSQAGGTGPEFATCNVRGLHSGPQSAKLNNGSGAVVAAPEPGSGRQPPARGAKRSANSHRRPRTGSCRGHGSTSREVARRRSARGGGGTPVSFSLGPNRRPPPSGIGPSAQEQRAAERRHGREASGRPAPSDGNTAGGGGVAPNVIREKKKKSALRGRVQAPGLSKRTGVVAELERNHVRRVHAVTTAAPSVADQSTLRSDVRIVWGKRARPSAEHGAVAQAACRQ